MIFELDLNFVCDTRNVDLIFVLDESNSVGHKNFSIATNFIANITESFDTSEGNVRVGLIKYATRPITLVNLGQYTNFTEFKGGIQYISILV